MNRLFCTSLWSCLLLMTQAVTPARAQQKSGTPGAALGDVIQMCATKMPAGAPGLWVPDTNLRWDPGTTLKIRFLDGSVENRKLVMSTIREWSAEANVFFKEVDDGGQIVVSFAGTGYWSLIGRNSLTVKTSPSMNLGFESSPQVNLSAAQKRSIILHEFGHALGFGHEHQSPDAEIHWNREKVLKYYSGPPNNWTQVQIESNILNPTRPEESKKGLWSKFDPKSIMMYPVEKRFTTDGFSVEWNAGLSKVDKAKAAEFYPKE